MGSGSPEQDLDEHQRTLLRALRQSLGPKAYDPNDPACQAADRIANIARLVPSFVTDTRPGAVNYEPVGSSTGSFRLSRFALFIGMVAMLLFGAALVAALIGLDPSFRIAMGTGAYGLANQVIGYYFGSSSGSEQKNSIMERLVHHVGSATPTPETPGEPSQ